MSFYIMTRTTFPSARVTELSPFTLDRAIRHYLQSRLWFFFSPFLFPPKKKREEEKENEFSKNRDFESCLSARSLPCGSRSFINELTIHLLTMVLIIGFRNQGDILVKVCNKINKEKFSFYNFTDPKPYFSIPPSALPPIFKIKQIIERKQLLPKYGYTMYVYENVSFCVQF